VYKSPIWRQIFLPTVSFSLQKTYAIPYYSVSEPMTFESSKTAQRYDKTAIKNKKNAKGIIFQFSLPQLFLPTVQICRNRFQTGGLARYGIFPIINMMQMYD
jgi:hypothetical protein